MANTTGFKARVEYEVTDGTQMTYTFPFSYLRKKFVMVSILHSDASETALEYGVDYTVNDLSVSLTAPAQVGEHIIIYRQTSTDKIVTWNDGSILLARDMNTEDAQMLHLQEEQQDYIMAHAISTKVTSDKEVLWDALNHRVINVSDPKDPQDVVTKNYMESVQGGFVAANTKILNDAKDTLSATKQTQSKAQSNETLSKAWATSTESPDNAEDAQSSTGKTQSSRSWALYSEGKAQEAAISEAHAKASETNAKTSETNAKTSETNALQSEKNAKVSETNAKSSETNAKTSETNAKSSETNAKTSETNAANSAKQAAESAGVFQDFKGATADTDGIGGKVPKPLAGQQNKVLKADGTWGDGVTPKTLFDGMRYYPINYAPADFSNKGWNSLGFCSIYYTERATINNKPSSWGQLINLPVNTNSESTQLWIGQTSGELFSRAGNSNIQINDTAFRRFAFSDEVEQVVNQGSNWIRYKSGLQLCWVTSIGSNSWWSFPVAFSSIPVVQFTDIGSDWSWVSSLSTTGCKHASSGTGNGFAIGWWK